MAFNLKSFLSSKEFKDIEYLYKEISENIDDLNRLVANNHNYLSLLTDYRQQYTKIFLIACANSFEKKIPDFLPTLLNINNCCVRKTFIEKKALNQKYHTLFNWDANNANQFISSFGENVSSKFKIDRNNEKSNFLLFENDFIKLGRNRNIIAHEGVLNYSFQLDLDEVYIMYKNAKKFIALVFKEIDGQL